VVLAAVVGCLLALPMPASAQNLPPCDPLRPSAILFLGLPTRVTPLQMDDFGFQDNPAAAWSVFREIHLRVVRPDGTGTFADSILGHVRGGHLYWLQLGPPGGETTEVIVSASFIEMDDAGNQCLRVIERTVREGPPMRLVIRATSRGVRSLGPHRVRSHPSFAGAIRAFGDPDKRASSQSGSGCRVTWPLIGLVIRFADLGGRDACSPNNGRTQNVAILGEAGRAWRTSRGLRIGHSVRQLRRRYPSASLHGRRTWWLVTGRTRIGRSCNGGACPYPVLSAVTRDGRIAAFRLRVGAAGD
jgi:hypothetical protein